MARPCKSAKVLTDKSQTKAEIEGRISEENKLKGNKLPSAPKWLTVEQKKLFRTILNELKSADILGKLDVWILTECVTAIDRNTDLERQANEDPSLIYSKEFLSAKEKYTKIFFRCCNELSLSPQSRAKIAGLAAAKQDDGTELLKKIIAGSPYDDEDDE